LYKLFNEPDIIGYIKVKRLEWAGHLIRASEYSRRTTPCRLSAAAYSTYFTKLEAVTPSFNQGLAIGGEHRVELIGRNAKKKETSGKTKM
jgi:hypothetical protein